MSSSQQMRTTLDIADDVLAAADRDRV